MAKPRKRKRISGVLAAINAQQKADKEKAKLAAAEARKERLRVEAETRLAAAQAREKVREVERQTRLADTEAQATAKRIRQENEVAGIGEARMVARGLVSGRKPKTEPDEFDFDPLHAPPPPEGDYIARADSQGRITRDYLPPVPAVPAPASVVPGLTHAAKPLPPPPPANTRHSMSPQAQAHRALQLGVPVADGLPFVCPFPGNGVEIFNSTPWTNPSAKDL